MLLRQACAAVDANDQQRDRHRVRQVSPALLVAVLLLSRRRLFVSVRNNATHSRRRDVDAEAEADANDVDGVQDSERRRDVLKHKHGSRARCLSLCASIDAALAQRHRCEATRRMRCARLACFVSPLVFVCLFVCKATRASRAGRQFVAHRQRLRCHSLWLCSRLFARKSTTTTGTKHNFLVGTAIGWAAERLEKLTIVRAPAHVATACSLDCWRSPAAAEAGCSLVQRRRCGLCVLCVASV